METCRTCAKCDFEDDNKWLNLFHTGLKWKQEIEQIRIEFINWKLQIAPNDGLPQKICTDCFSKFCNVNTFRLACQQAQVKLNNIFDKIEIQSDINDDDLQETENNAFTDSTNIFKFRLEPTESIRSKTNDSTNSSESTSPIMTRRRSTRRAVSKLKKENKKNKNTAVNVNQNETLPTIPPHTLITMQEKMDNHHQQQQQQHRNDEETNSCAETIAAVQNLIEFDENAQDENNTNESSYIDTTEDNDDGIIERFEPLVSNTITLGGQSGLVEDNNSLDIPIAFECKYCYKQKDSQSEHFLTQSALLKHLTEAHKSDQPYNCPYCSHCFQDFASRTVHIKDQHVEKHYTCEVCGKKYADRFNLRHHVEKYHSETDFECEQCEKRFYSRKSLNYHMKWHKPERQFKCSFMSCDRLFINQRHLKCHEATHTGIRNSECCTFCGKSFIHLKTLRWHIYRQHGGEKPFKCGSCKEVFASYLEKRIHMLENHLENLTTIEKTECMLCHIRYENENDLKSHIIDEHQAAATTRKSAIKVTNNKRILQDKKQKHYSGIFFCEVCSQRFNMKSALERHQAVHKIEGRPHACPKCPKRFKRIQDMNWHMKTHSNEKPNICDVCGKGFALKYVLNQHKRSHEVLEKNFTCEICGRSYLFEKSLRVHERVHTGKTYYKCDLCNESFVTHIKFTCHMRKMHDTAAQSNDKELPLDDLINIVMQ